MKKHTLLRTLIILAIITLNIGCDQVSKSIVRRNVEYNETIELIHHNFILTKVENTGAFLSLGDDLPGPAKDTLLLLLPALALLVTFGITLFHTTLDKGIVLGLCFVVGGGMGNIFDRLMYGSVTDFLHIDLDMVRTGVFNMADVSIMTGAALILIQSQFKKEVSV